MAFPIPRVPPVMSATESDQGLGMLSRWGRPRVVVRAGPLTAYHTRTRTYRD